MLFHGYKSWVQLGGFVLSLGFALTFAWQAQATIPATGATRPDPIPLLRLPQVKGSAPGAWFGRSSGRGSALRAWEPWLGGGITATDREGLVPLGFGGGRDGAQALVLQPDGKIVVAGQSAGNGNEQFALVRYQRDGSLDLNFGQGGKLITSFGFSGSGISALALQADGKIVAAGYSRTNPNSIFAVVRYHSDGRLDQSFGSNGKVTTTFFGASGGATSVVLQADGKIVVAGWAWSNNSADFVLVRYLSNGSRDPSFGVNGSLFAKYETFDSLAYALVVQPDGKLVAGGIVGTGTGGKFALMRFHSNGSLDTSFDGDGKLITSLGPLEDGIHDLALQPDGKIVAAGTSYDLVRVNVAVVRYLSDGRLDTSFANGGKLITAVGPFHDEASAVTLQPDGKIVVAGYSRTLLETHFAVVRYLTDGGLDSSFANNGSLTTALGYLESGAGAVAWQPDGKIVAAGTSATGILSDFAVTRYLSNGQLDVSWASTGKLLTDVGDARSEIRALAWQADGKLIVAGSHQNWAISGNEFAVARFLPDLNLDPSFDGDGKLTTTFDLGNDVARAVVSQPDGKVIVAGSGLVPPHQTAFAVARYCADGSLDTSFAGTGKVTTTITPFVNQGNTVALQPDGKIVVAGSSGSLNGELFSLVRYHSDGGLDTSFANGGKQTTSFDSASAVANALARQSDGKLVLAGYSYQAGKKYVALARYHSDGSLDTSFAASGKLTLAFGSANDEATALAVQPDGKLVVAGYTGDDLNRSFALARLNSDGSLDRSFAEDGKLTTAAGSSYSTATALTLRPDGKILLAGTCTSVSGYDFVVVQYLPNGALDHSWGEAGSLRLNFGSEDFAHALGLQPDGRVLVAGQVDALGGLVRLPSDACAGLSLSPDALPAGFLNTPYQLQLQQTGAGAPLAWHVSGMLPENLILDPVTGILSGTPASLGSYDLSIQVTAASGCTRRRSYQFEVVCPPLAITPGTLPSGTVNVPYSQFLQVVNGGLSTFQYALEPGAQLPNLTLSSSGLLNGWPLSAGVYPFTVKAIGPGGCSVSHPYQLVICDALTLSPNSLPNGLVGTPYTQQLSLGESSTPPTTWMLSAGTLPPGLSLAASTGALTGTPAAAGEFTFTVQARDGNGCSGTREYRIQISGDWPSDQTAGSVLIYNLFTSAATNPQQQNTRLSLTNTHPQLSAYLHLFFIDGESCAVADSYLCLTANQTAALMVADLDPGTSGYVIVVATDRTGCPLNFNFLVGDAYVKLASGHAANLGAVAIPAVARDFPACDAQANTATLAFDGVRYGPLPHVVAASYLGARADGNDTLLVLNRLGGNLATGAARLTEVFGVLYDDAEQGLSFTFSPNTCQLRNRLGNHFPRTTPRYETHLPAGRSGWLKLWGAGGQGISGAVLNYHPQATSTSGAFQQGHNLHSWRTTASETLTIPVFPPTC